MLICHFLEYYTLVGNQFATMDYFGDKHIQKQNFKSGDFVPIKVYNRNHKKNRYLSTI